MLTVFIIPQGFTRQQMSLVEKNTVMIEEREKEIISIVQSISEINEMYRDLATLVVDQVSSVPHWLYIRSVSTKCTPRWL